MTFISSKVIQRVRIKPKLTTVTWQPQNSQQAKRRIIGKQRFLYSQWKKPRKPLLKAKFFSTSDDLLWQSLYSPRRESSKHKSNRMHQQDKEPNVKENSSSKHKKVTTANVINISCILVINCRINHVICVYYEWLS